MNMRPKDPVCGCSVDPMFTSRRETFGSSEYYFCSDACLSRFRTEPTRYTGTP